MNIKCMIAVAAMAALAISTNGCGNSAADSYQDDGASSVNQNDTSDVDTSTPDNDTDDTASTDDDLSGGDTNSNTGTDTSDNPDSGTDTDSNTDAGNDTDSTDNTDTEDNTSDSGSDDNSSDTEEPAVDYGNVADAGPYEHTREDGIELPGADGRSMTTTVCTPDSNETHALILLSPGFQLGRDLYESYCAHLASWGYIAVLQTYSEGGFFMSHGNLAADTSGLIDWLESDGAANFPEWNGQIGLTGHSLGGKLSLLAASQDSRIGAVVALDPVDSDDVPVAPDRMQDVEAPVLILGEMLDSTGSFQACAPEADNFRQFFDASRTGTIEIELFGAGHMDFLDNPNCIFCTFCQNGDLGGEVVQAIARRSMIGFFGKHLKADANFEKYIAGEPVQADAQDGILSIRTR